MTLDEELEADKPLRDEIARLRVAMSDAIIVCGDPNVVRILRAALAPAETGSEHPDPAKRCQHDLLQPGSTILVTLDSPSAQEARCAVCLGTWRIPRGSPMSLFVPGAVAPASAGTSIAASNDRADAVAVITVCQGCASEFRTNLPRSCPKCQAAIDKLTRVLVGSDGIEATRRALAARTLLCSACGADRAREPCRRPIGAQCAMVGVAHQPFAPASEGRDPEALRLLNAAEILLRGYGRTALADEIVAWINGAPQPCDDPESEEMRLLTALVSVKPGCASFDKLMREATQFVAREKLPGDCWHCGGHPAGLGDGKPCPTCGSPGLHASDCAVNNGPALPVGPCDCRQPLACDDCWGSGKIGGGTCRACGGTGKEKA